MTVSSNWWKAVAKPFLVALPLGLLAACGRNPLTDSGLMPLPAPKPIAPEAALRVQKETGLMPLPTAQQVATSVALGRPNPFAPPLVAATASGATRPKPPAPMVLPEGFAFTGVIVTGGEVQALVQLGSLSGSLRVGDSGGRTTDLLPSGWSVARIDVQRGVLSLRQGKRNLAVEI